MGKSLSGSLRQKTAQQRSPSRSIIYKKTRHLRKTVNHALSLLVTERKECWFSRATTPREWVVFDQAPCVPRLLLLLAISAEVVGTSCLKLSEDSAVRPNHRGADGYGITSLMARVLQVLPIGLTYALWSGSASWPSC